MPATRLRIYRGTEENHPETREAGATDTMTLPLSEILPLLADAYHSRRTWLADFEQDDVTIPSDLYEVLLAYRFYNRPA